MAQGSIMLQIDVLQEIDEPVTFIPPVTVMAFHFLSFDKTTVREITSQKTGGILAGAIGSTIGFSGIPHAELRLFLRGGEEAFFIAPTHVSSPQFEAGFAILELKDIGITGFDDTKVRVSRRIGGHAYLDEVP
ncbi:hypothetical protein [Nitrosomonas sp. Nm166]|uniref:hypothetical protein n=1 Tax=Nitrosomonas sp. Nm166 TaxID=1881054 RepID=UPI0008EE0253|nr:hypothetical protein [Nitrosomonas sp. Nm166]SFD86209.1 hypothetical protein SAMN05428977_100193 [Nitrosomonas sp. Nm166]